EEIEVNALHLLRICHHPEVRIGRCLKAESNMFLQQRHAERVVPAPEAVEQIKRFEMELHAPVLHLPEIKYLVDQAKQDMHILFHQLEEMARLSVEGAVGKKLLYGIGYQRQRSTEIMRNIREEHQLGVRSLLQFMGKLFQLR